MLTITDRQLAGIIGKQPKPDGRIFWSPEDLPAITIALRALLTLDHDSYLVDSETMPHWLHLAIASTVAEKGLSIKDLDHGPVLIPSLPIEPAGEGLTFYVAEEGSFTLVEFSIGRRVTPADLLSIVLPTVSPNKGVVIAGSAPPWLSAAIGLSYAQVVPWVASTQKTGSAVVACSKNPAMLAGSTIEQDKLTSAKEHLILRTKIKRGDIWWFQYSAKPHPGLIVSTDEANERLTHVLLIPITSTPWRSAQNLVLLPMESTPGLIKDSYAVCEDLSKIEIKDLGNGPYATITDDLLMQKIIQQIRLVIGDDTTTA